jgi:predicted regulator of Ras-like GTPase activity (Roadblock/LC7/MglB family)
LVRPFFWRGKEIKVEKEIKIKIMATKKKAAAKRRMTAMKVGAGVAAGIAGALAGAYLLYERSKPRQRHAKAWVMKARKAAGIEAKQLSSIGENEYRRIVEKAMKHYGAMNKIGGAEIMAAVRDAKSEWKHIQMQAKKAVKPTLKRPARKAKKTKKKASRRR